MRGKIRIIALGLAVSSSCSIGGSVRNDGERGELSFVHFSGPGACEQRVRVTRWEKEWSPNCQRGDLNISTCATHETRMPPVRVVAARCNDAPCPGFRTDGADFFFVPNVLEDVRVSVEVEVDGETREDATTLREFELRRLCPTGLPSDASAEPPPMRAEAAAGPCDPAAPFGALALVPGLEKFAASHPDLSDDELSITFDLEEVDGDRNVFIATRPIRTSPFSAPERLDASVNGPSDDVEARRLPLGQGFVLSSNRLGAGFDLFGAGPLPNSPANEGNPFLLEDELWFTSDRSGRSRIYTVPLGDSGSADASVREDLSLDAREFVLDRSGLTILFAAETGDWGIYRAVRPTRGDAFGAAVFVPELDTPGDDHPGWLSADGCRLYMTSTVSGVARLYVTQRSLN